MKGVGYGFVSVADLKEFEKLIGFGEKASFMARES